MIHIAIWFIMHNGTTYIPYLDMKTVPVVCGVAGAVVGVKVNQQEDPTKVLWPDPHAVGLHCEGDISARVQGLAEGRYHIATTEMPEWGTPSYIGIDPHTTTDWFRGTATTGFPPRTGPANLRIRISP